MPFLLNEYYKPNFAFIFIKQLSCSIFSAVLKNNSKKLEQHFLLGAVSA